MGPGMDRADRIGGAAGYSLRDNAIWHSAIMKSDPAKPNPQARAAMDDRERMRVRRHALRGETLSPPVRRREK